MPVLVVRTCGVFWCEAGVVEVSIGTVFVRILVLRMAEHPLRDHDCGVFGLPTELQGKLAFDGRCVTND
jgi:hypothetical protein